MSTENKIIYVAPLRANGNGVRATFVRPQYLDGLEQAGLEAQILPVGSKYSAIKQQMSSARGLLLVGGSDINPQIYGQQALSTTEVTDHDRDSIELQVLEMAFQMGIPILGICRGAQMMAVSRGGQLIQHIEGHSVFPPVYESLQLPTSHHEVRIDPNSIVGRALTDENETLFTNWNSMHHQSVHPGKLPKGAKVSAISVADAVIEAIEFPEFEFVVGIQAHPEADLTNMGKIFTAFSKVVRKRI